MRHWLSIASLVAVLGCGGSGPPPGSSATHAGTRGAGTGPTEHTKPLSFDADDAEATARWFASLSTLMRDAVGNDLATKAAETQVREKLAALKGKKIRWRLSVDSVKEWKGGRAHVFASDFEWPPVRIKFGPASVLNADAEDLRRGQRITVEGSLHNVYFGLPGGEGGHERPFYVNLEKEGAAVRPLKPE